jgi:4-carboxymuconolactone decarboxylase
MARLPYVRTGTSADVDELFGEIERMGRPVLNLYRILANQPPALGAFLGMSQYVRSASSLEPGLRELMILATAHELDQSYEIAHHSEAAARVGVPPAKTAAVGPGGSLDALSPSERCVVEFARQAAHTRTCDDAMFARMQSLFTPQEIIDLVVTTAWYHLCAVILGATRVELETEGR